MSYLCLFFIITDILAEKYQILSINYYQLIKEIYYILISFIQNPTNSRKLLYYVINQYNLLTICLFSSMQSYTIFQRQQITQDCCLSVPFTANQTSIPSRLMNYSSGKSQRSKQKKINLSIGKGKSQEKLRGISLTQTSNLQQSASLKAVGDKKCQSHMSTTGSKQTSQINSLKASMIRHEAVLRGDKRISLKIQRNGQAYPLRPNPDQITFHQTKAEITNLQLISDITMVEEEFISHGSTTLNAINCLASNDRIRSQESTIKPYQKHKGQYQTLMRGNNTVRIVSNFPMGEDQVKQLRSPLQRLAQRRRQPTRKLIL